MKLFNLLYTSGAIGFLGFIAHQIAEDYWMFHPSIKVRTRAYAIRQTCRLIACLFFPYMIVLGIFCALLYLGD